MICSQCRQMCDITIVDDSWDHEFGTEIRAATVSDCHEADVLDDQGRVIYDLPCYDESSAS